MILRVFFRGGLIAGLIVFIWNAFSWTALSWHQNTIEHFENEHAVSQVLKENATSGHAVYLLPNSHIMPEGELTEQDIITMNEASLERLNKGPVALVAIRPNGINMMNRGYFISLLMTQILGALLITAIVYRAKIPTFAMRLLTVELIVLTGGIICHLPYWNMWHFSPSFVLTNIADLGVAWFFGGLVIAWATGRKIQRVTEMQV
jgi:hypothetical protein